MNCSNCSKPLREGANFCVYCGAPARPEAPSVTSAPAETAAPARVMTDEDRVAFYRLCAEAFGVNKEVDAAALGQALSRSEHKWKSYGVNVLWDFLDLLGEKYVSHRIENINGTRHVRATFLPVDGIEIVQKQTMPTSAIVRKAITEAERIQIYHLCVSEFGCDKAIAGATVGKMLTDSGIQWKQYGRSKLADFFSQCIGAPYVAVMLSEKGHPFVTFSKVDVKAPLPPEDSADAEKPLPIGAQPMSAEARLSVYRLCATEFGTDRPVSGVHVGKLLSSRKINWRAYGCKKMADFFRLLGAPYAAVTSKYINGTEQPFVTFLSVEGIDIDAPAMTEAERQNIYLRCAEHFGLGAPIGGPALGSFLTSNHIDWKRFGCAKIGDFFSRHIGAPYVSVVNQDAGGTLQPFVTFLPVNNIEVNASEAQEAEAAEAPATPVESAPAKAAASTRPTMTEAERVRAYRLCAEKYGFNKPVTCPPLGIALSRGKFNWREYGCSKIIDFFEQLIGIPYVVVDRDGDQPTVTLQPVAGIEVALPQEKTSAEEAAPVEEIAPIEEIAPVEEAAPAVTVAPIQEVKSAFPSLSEAERKRIHAVGVTKIGINKPTLVAAVGSVLGGANIAWRNYGCKTLTDFLRSLVGEPYVSVSAAENNPGQYLITFLPVPGVSAAPKAPSAPAASAPKAVAVATKADRERFYLACANELGIDTPTALAQVGSVLSSARIGWKSYGQPSLAAFLENVIGEPYVTVVASEKDPAHLLAIFHQVEGVTVTPSGSAAIPVDPTELYGIVPRLAAAVADLPETMEGAISCSEDKLAKLNDYICGVRTKPSADVVKKLYEAYATARRERRFEINQKQYTFLLPRALFGTEDDMSCTIEADEKDATKTWRVKCFENCATMLAYRKITDFAHIPRYIPAAANNAANPRNVKPEGTKLAYDLCGFARIDQTPGVDISDQPRNRWTVERMDNYIRFTFLRLAQTGKVMFSKNKDFAAFNTGLVNHDFSPIFACFERNTPGRKQQWRYSYLCCAGDHNGTHDMRVKLCNVLPKRATYFESLHDVVFDPENTVGDLAIDYEHILLDNIARLPLSFLELRMSSDAEVMSRIRDIRANVGDNKEEYRKLRKRLETLRSLGDHRWGKLLKDFEGAVDQAVAMSRENYKRAVPCFFPKLGRVSLMLPLCLETNRVDVALAILYDKKSNTYTGKTIFSLDMAYNDARLICRPETNWLNTSIALVDSPEPEFSDTEDDEAEEDDND